MINIHRYVCRGAEKPGVYTCLFLPNMVRLYTVWRRMSTDLWAAPSPTIPWTRLMITRTVWGRGCIPPPGWMIRKEFLCNTWTLYNGDFFYSTWWYLNYSFLVLKPACLRGDWKSLRIYKHLRNDIMPQGFTAENGDWPSERKVFGIFYFWAVPVV